VVHSRRPAPALSPTSFPADVRTRVAAAEEIPALAELYASWGYPGGMRPEDVVFVAERDGACVGIVRRTWEHGTLMLRGMYVAPDARGRGIGRTLLDAFVAALDEDETTRGVPCYGIPFAHLEHFYGLGGFTFLPADEMPEFLRQRIARYTAEGYVVAAMARPPAIREEFRPNAV
jgi:GNAT superfamily N-acetyltransferase